MQGHRQVKEAGCKEEEGCAQRSLEVKGGTAQASRKRSQSWKQQRKSRKRDGERERERARVETTHWSRERERTTDAWHAKLPQAKRTQDTKLTLPSKNSDRHTQRLRPTYEPRPRRSRRDVTRYTSSESPHHSSHDQCTDNSGRRSRQHDHSPTWPARCSRHAPYVGSAGGRQSRGCESVFARGR